MAFPLKAEKSENPPRYSRLRRTDGADVFPDVKTSNIVDRIRHALDAHLMAQGERARVVRLGRAEWTELDDFIRRYALAGPSTRVRGPAPIFDDIPIQKVDIDSYLSTERPDLPG